MIKASDLFVSCLEAEWVTTIYGVPGEENLDVVESLRVSNIELIVTRNEQTAVFMAATYGRLTWKTGVALATLGPGATNMMTWVAFWQLWGMPVLVITGQKPIKQSKQWRFQVLDVVSMMQPLTKMATSIVNIHRIPSTIRQAFKTAEQERPWAVHIEFAEDIAREVTKDTLIPVQAKKIRRPQIDEKMLTTLVHALKNAKHPMILIGAWANRKRISKYLTKFIEKTNIPFFTSQMGKWVVNELLPQYIGTAALTSNDYIHDVINMSDCILAVGHDVIEKPTNIIHDPKVQLIHINFSSADIDQLYAPDLEVVWDIGNTFWQLFEHKDFSENTWNFEDIYAVCEKNKIKLEKHLQDEYTHNTLGPRRLAKELREIMNEKDILALDNGLYKVWIARNYPAVSNNTVLLDNALATMGAGYSAAMAAKLIHPEQQVVCLTGDGWFMMNLGDFETAVRLQLDLTIILLNDNAYGMIKWKQHNMWFEDFSLDLKNPDFMKLAEAFGAHAHKVETADTFTSTIETAMQEPGVSLVEVIFKYPQKIA